MEDLATARIAVAQTAQRIIHRARATDTEEEHDLAGVKGLLQSELADILSRRGDNPAAAERYRKAYKIALRWIRNYTEMDFRSLGSYSRADLDAIADGAGGVVGGVPLHGAGGRERFSAGGRGPAVATDCVGNRPQA